MDGRPKRIKKFAFTSVCIYNRLRVDGALGNSDIVTNSELGPQIQHHSYTTNKDDF